MQTMKFKDIGGGLKGINFEAWGGFDNFLLATSTGGGGGGRSTLLRRVVPWLAKASNMTANAISDLPFDITRPGGDVYDTSVDWQNNLGGMPNPKRLIFLLASSLCSGRAYVIPTVTSSQIVELHYCAPHTVSELISVQGLENFTRTSDFGGVGIYAPAGEEAGEGYSGEMMYFWLPDSDIELGPAKCYPLATALLSTENIANMDITLLGYSERGFIPPTILAVKGMPGTGEREKTETWWNKFLRGWTKTVAKVVNAEAMDIKQIGAGFEQLNGVYKDLTRQMIENIGAAHGIPSALFMSDMAFATEFNSMIKMWYTTSEFISIYHCIEETMNEQLLKRFGLRMQFKPETIDAFQEDENERASAFKLYVDTGIRPSIVSDMLGLELPEGVESSALDEKFDKPVPVPVIVSQGARNDAVPNDTAPPEEKKPFQPRKEFVLDAQQIKDLDLWRQVAVRNHRKGKGNAIDFECKELPASIADPIRARLLKADNELDILKSFDVANNGQTDYSALLEAMRYEMKEIANSQLGNTKTEHPIINVNVEPTPVNVNVEPAAVNVTVTPSTAKVENVVNVPAPEVVINEPPKKKMKAKINRDGRGNITGIEES